MKKIGFIFLSLFFVTLACAEGGNETVVSDIPNATNTSLPETAPASTPDATIPPTVPPTPETKTSTPRPESPYSCIPDSEKEIGLVTNIVDGDTIDAIINGEEQRIRYIGMDTPETEEGFGPKATAFNASLVMNKIITLYKDVSETDRYGRLLRYVFVDNLFVNHELVREGYAQPATYPPDVACASLFSEAQGHARANNLGLWQAAPLPTGSPTGSSSTSEYNVEIINVDKREEYVDIRNNGSQPADLSGWLLLSERGNQDCPLSGTLGPGEVLRIWARAEDKGKGGFNCEYGTNIWNNSKSDPAILYNLEHVVVDTYP